MEKNQKTVYAIWAAVAAIALVVIGIGIGKIVFEDRDTQDSTNRGIATTSDSSSAGTQSAAMQREEQTAASQADSALSACENSVRAAAAKQGTGFERGTILVSFDPDIAYAEAIAILDSFGLKPHNTASSKADFTTNHWLSVSVGQGKEFEEICALRGRDGVKYAGPNYTFDLHE